MAKFLKGIHGAYSGKVGNVVGSSWRNVDYVKSLPKQRSTKATPAQLAQQAKFALAVSFLSPIKDLLNLGYSDHLLGKSTGYNKALQYALSHAISGEYPDLEVDYSAVVVSRGPLSNLMGVSWQETSAREIRLSWFPETNRFNAFADDSVIFLFYNKEKKFFNLIESGTRADGVLELTLPDAYEGDHLVGWVFAGHRDGVKTSTSMYLGELEIT